ncbi:MAG: CCA tRNA nucleotidyltransferase [Actinomycetes bacterium]
MSRPRRPIDDDALRRAVAELLRVAPVADALAERLAASGHALALVGGSVRDALLGRLSQDLDFATDARPDEVLAAVRGWAEATWTTGINFGTVGIGRDGWRLEVTTYRAEAYDRTSRKPQVAYGDSLEADLERRDFTVNAMAVTLPERTFVDPYGGLDDLRARVLRTPGSAVASFDDDPLRIMRAGRFVAQLGWSVADDVVTAMAELSGRLEIVSPERKRDELTKLLLGAEPVRGLRLLADTGAADLVVPELSKLKATVDEHRRHKDVYEHTLTVLTQAVMLERERGFDPDLVVRLAALLHDIGKPKTRSFESGGGVSFHHHEVVGAAMTRSRLSELRFPKHVVEDVSRLVELHLRFHGYAEGEWTDAAVRRYVRDAGHLLDRLHVLTRSDCTTRNKAKAARLAAAYDDLEARIARLAAEEELRAIKPRLDGGQVMAYLGQSPGPIIGQALKFLLELRLERGPMTADQGYEALRTWAVEQGLADPGRPPSEPGAKEQK